MNLNDIGIGIIDVYNQVNLDNCIKSIPETLKENVLIVSNTNNTLPFKSTRFLKEVSFASLKNKLISQFRLQQKQFLFLINSNYAITEDNFFENYIKVASNFGTWFLTGPGSNSLFIDDEEKNLALEVSPELNDNVLFIHTNVIKKYGYFNEQLYSNNQLDTLDYILRLRKDGLYPPTHFNPVMSKGLYKTPVKLNKIVTSDERSMQLSFGLFQHLHQFIPGYNDPVGVSSDEMFLEVEKIQKNYARPL